MPSFAVYPVEDHFAEKLHAYTAPREPRTRVKDLVDMVLFIEEDLQRTVLLEKAIDATFARYKRHVRSDVLPRPPAEWQAGFERMAGQVKLSVVTIDEAFELLSLFLTGNGPPADERRGQWG